MVEHREYKSNITSSAGLGLVPVRSGWMMLAVLGVNHAFSPAQTGIGVHNCGHSEDVAIFCSDTRISSTNCSIFCLGTEVPAGCVGTWYAVRRFSQCARASAACMPTPLIGCQTYL